MVPLHLNLKLESGSGYGYALIPSDQLSTSEDTTVMVSIGDREISARALALYSGQHMIYFSRETMNILEIQTGQTYLMQIEPIDAPPQLNDLPEDLLSALQHASIEEDFKRLSTDEQKEIYRQVRAADSARAREQVIRRAVVSILDRRADLPRGDAL